MSQWLEDESYPAAQSATSISLSLKGVDIVKGFYQLHYSKALRTFSLSVLEVLTCTQMIPSLNSTIVTSNKPHLDTRTASEHIDMFTTRSAN